MFDNLSIEEATIAYIIKVYKSFDNTITQYDIADEFMIRQMQPITPRRVRRIIESLIEKGLPILSTPNKPNPGYCWFTHDSERVQCIQRLRRKAAKIFIRAKKASAIPLHSTILPMNILLEGEWKYHQGKLEGLLKD